MRPTGGGRSVIFRDLSKYLLKTGQRDAIVNKFLKTFKETDFTTFGALIKAFDSDFELIGDRCSSVSVDVRKNAFAVGLKNDHDGALNMIFYEALNVSDYYELLNGWAEQDHSGEGETPKDKEMVKSLYNYRDKDRKYSKDVIEALRQANPTLLTKGSLTYVFQDYLGLALKSVTDEQVQAFFEAYEKSKYVDEVLKKHFDKVKRIIQDRLGEAPFTSQKVGA